MGTLDIQPVEAIVASPPTGERDQRDSSPGRARISIVGFLLDTSAVNRICDGAVGADRWSPAYITDVVLQEICRATDDRRRALLDVLLRRIGPGGILRSGQHLTAHHDPIDQFDEPPWSDPQLSLGRLFPLITGAVGTNFRRHAEDGFIADVAIRHGLTLVTGDKKLAKVARQFGAKVEYIA